MTTKSRKWVRRLCSTMMGVHHRFCNRYGWSELAHGRGLLDLGGSRLCRSVYRQ